MPTKKQIDFQAADKAVRRVALIFDNMQTARIELIRVAENIGLKSTRGKAVLRLAQLLEEMKDSAKDEFAKLATEAM